MVVVGAGGMGHCVLDVVDAVNAAQGDHVEVVGVVDDGSPDVDRIADRGLAFLGGVETVRDLPRDVGYVIGIGSPQARRRVDVALASDGRACPTLVHPNAHVGFDVVLGHGTVVCSHVSIENHIRLGRHVHVNQNSTVGHDSRVSDYCTISPMVAVSGGVRLGAEAFLGSGASLLQGVTVGAGAVVGLGAAVIHDVPASTTVVGVPARPTRPGPLEAP